MNSRAPSLRVAVLCSDDAHHRYLVARLAERFELCAVVIHGGRNQVRRLRQKKKYRDWLAYVYHGWRRRLLGLDRYRRRYFGAESFPLLSCPVLDTFWINDPEVHELLRRVRPGVVVVMGTGILSRATLQACGGSVINIHGGHLPDYRGNHCFFFALYHGDYEKIGSTIHFIDEGVDTGDIIEVVKPPVEKEDNAEKLYCRAEKLAIERLVDWLGRLERGEALPRAPQGPGRTFRTRDRKPWHDLSVWWRRKTGRLTPPPHLSARRRP